MRINDLYCVTVMSEVMTENKAVTCFKSVIKNVIESSRLE